MTKINSFEDLEVWQKTVDLAVDIYKITEKDGIRHDYGMKDQMRRSATSISNDISEGFEYNNNKQFVNFLKIVKNSAGELRNQLLIIYRVGKINEQEYTKLKSEVTLLSKQIAGFIKYLQGNIREQLK